MKRICDPSSGKLGNQVYLIGRNGQVVRTRVVPSNPKSSPQLTQRAILTTQSKGWNAITQAQQLAWISAAANEKSTPRLGMFGPLTGNQHFVAVNSNLATYGQETVADPPQSPTFPALAPAGLVITNPAGVVALKLTCPNDPGSSTFLRASAPLRNGVHRTPQMVIIGSCPAPQTGSANITGLYVARFGVPPVGSKVFVEAFQMTSGFQDTPRIFSAIVPVST